MENNENRITSLNEYQHQALRTINPDLTRTQQLENGLIGLVAEGGEALDVLKKSLFQGHIFDLEHIVRELGDALWYMAVAAWALGYDLDEIATMNIEKLRARYPEEGFEVSRSLNRKDGDI